MVFRSTSDEIIGASHAVFDLDGTLFDLPVDWAPLRQQLADMCVRDGCADRPGRIRDAYEYAGTRPELKERMLRLHTEHEAIGLSNARELPAAILARSRLERGMSTSVFTMNTRSTAVHLLGGWGFDIMVPMDDVVHPKPHPEGLLQIMEKTGLAAEDVLMVGNSDLDRQASGAAGIRYIDVTEL